MKILLTNFHPHGGGGHTTYLKYLFQELTKIDSIDVCIACPKSSKLYALCSQINHKNTFSIDFPAKIKEIGNVILNTKKLAKLIENYKFDILHVNGNPEHKMAMYCKIFYNLDFNIVRTKHDSKKIKTNFLTNLQFSKYTDQMIVVSNYQKNLLSNINLINKTTVIHNGINLDYFHPQNKNNDLIKKYNIQETDLVFVSVAGTALYKGWPDLVLAVSQLDPAIKKNIKIILAGTKPKDTVIENHVTKYNMNENVIFTGLIDDVRDLISLGDLGFVLSTNETISYACREMMAMGKPVLASNFAGLPENIKHSYDGWLITSNSIHIIKEIIVELFNDKNIIDKFAKNALKRAQDEFSLKHTIQKTVHIYNKTKG